ncbi:hypothetical protein EDD86DRAFT_273472 [Gorgonomyces haynaldii]|nr:hypothetical protein EDD86DRAFT_273472 [Gorgonomyces haynaldii]
MTCVILVIETTAIMNKSFSTLRSQYLEQILKSMDEDTLFGLVTFGDQAQIELLTTKHSLLNDRIDQLVFKNGSIVKNNLHEALQKAQELFQKVQRQKQLCVMMCATLYADTKETPHLIKTLAQKTHLSLLLASKHLKELDDLVSSTQSLQDLSTHPNFVCKISGIKSLKRPLMVQSPPNVDPETPPADQPQPKKARGRASTEKKQNAMTAQVLESVYKNNFVAPVVQKPSGPASIWIGVLTYKNSQDVGKSPQESTCQLNAIPLKNGEIDTKKWPKRVTVNTALPLSQDAFLYFAQHSAMQMVQLVSTSGTDQAAYRSLVQLLAERKVAAVVQFPRPPEAFNEPDAGLVIGSKDSKLSDYEQDEADEQSSPSKVGTIALSAANAATATRKFKHAAAV